MDTEPDSISQRESQDPATHLAEATPVEGLCHGMPRQSAPMTDRSAQAIECSTVQDAPTGTVQDTKPARQPHTAIALDTIEATETDPIVQRPHQATLGTQTDTKSEPRKPEITETNTETTSSPAPEMVNQMMNQSLVPPMCRCGRVVLPQETPALPDPSLDQQPAAELARESISPEGCAGVKTVCRPFGE